MRIDNTKLYKEILARNDDAVQYYKPFLEIVSHDMESFLANIKVLFPEYPDHGIEHSERIVKYLGDIISNDILSYLSSMDIIILLFSCLFHDSGMALFNAEEDDISKIRKQHPEYASVIINKYFDKYYDNMDEKSRVVNAIEFVCRAHGLSLDELLNDENFKSTDNIKFSDIHFGLLAFLLRIGDLLDIESSRSNSFRMYMFSDSFNAYSRAHNERHLKVNRYTHNPRSLEISVVAEDITQHKIWDDWFGYLDQDIRAFNNEFREEKLTFPILRSSIIKPDGTNYEVHELKFEIDENGGMWDILSKSVYTNDLDFLRELVQNAIDASLKAIYLNNNVKLKYASPRSWENKGKKVFIGFSAKKRDLYVVDNGIGMNCDDVSNFLFKLSSSGEANNTDRDFSFPGIAQYGIGFISCLIHSKHLEVYTSKDSEQLFEVSLDSSKNHAYIENLANNDGHVGTAIHLKLKSEYSAREIKEYLMDTFCYPSVPIVFFDIDGATSIEEKYKQDLNIQGIETSPYRIASVIERISKIASEFRKENSEKINAYKALNERINELNKNFNENIMRYISYKTDYKKFVSECHKINETIISLGIDNILSEIMVPSFESASLDSNLGEVRDTIVNNQREIQFLYMELTQRFQNYRSLTTSIGQEKVEHYEWKYFVAFLDDKLRIYKAEERDNLSGLSESNCIVLFRNALTDYESGIEYEAINGFLLSNGKLVARIDSLNPGESYTEKPTILSSWDCGQSLQAEVEDNSPWFESEDSWLSSSDEDYYDDDDFDDNLDDEEDYAFYQRNTYNNPKRGQNIKFAVDSILINNTGKFSLATGKAVKIAKPYGGNHFEELDIDRLDFDKEAFRRSEDIVRFINIIRNNTSLYCQDGIKIDVNINELFGLGFFNIICNCTAGSRMKLNVTRHEPSGIRDDVNQWLTGAGSTIQSDLLNQIKVSATKSNIEFSMKGAKSYLDNGKKNSTYFSRKSNDQLKSFLI